MEKTASLKGKDLDECFCHLITFKIIVIRKYILHQKTLKIRNKIKGEDAANFANLKIFMIV